MAIMAGSRTTSVTAPPVTPATTSFRVNVLQNLEVVLTGQQQQIAKFGSQRIESGGGDNSLFEYEETFLDDFPVEKGPPARQEKAQPPTGEASTLEALYSPAPLKAACDSCFADQSWLLATAETPAAKASEQESSAGMTPLAAAGGLFLLLGNVWQAPATRERTESRRKPAMA